jgi:hypothetical protein
MVTFTEKSSQFISYDKSAQQRLQRDNTRQFRATQESLHLNPIQRKMYRQVMYGLKELSPEQAAVMSPISLERIARDHERANKVLQILKARVYYDRYHAAEIKLLNAIFSYGYGRTGKVFSPIGSKHSDNMVKLPASATLNKLGISTRQVIQEFISANLLPQNFMQLSPQTLNL